MDIDRIMVFLCHAYKCNRPGLAYVTKIIETTVFIKIINSAVAMTCRSV